MLRGLFLSCAVVIRIVRICLQGVISQPRILRSLNLNIYSLHRFGDHEKKTSPISSDNDPTFDAVFAFPWLPGSYKTFHRDEESQGCDLTIMLVDHRHLRDDKLLGKVTCTGEGPLVRPGIIVVIC